MKLRVNGTEHEVAAPADMPLLWVLRDLLGLTGTKYGCGIAQCGACLVHVDGRPRKSCMTTAGFAEGKSVTTIEGLSKDGGPRGAAGLGRARRRAVRLLPVGPDHGGGLADCGQPAAHGRRTSTPRSRDRSAAAAPIRASGPPCIVRRN